MNMQELPPDGDNRDDRELVECSECGWEGKHECECGEELSEKQCSEWSGFCERCGWLLG